MKRTSHNREVEKKLLNRRDALRRSLSGDVNALKSMHESGVGDELDAALAGDLAEIKSQLAEVESRELAQIDHALERIRAGHYGECETCGQPIKAARLQALPYADECIKCAQTAERQSGGSSRERWSWSETGTPRKIVHDDAEVA